jgi:hypothetical protein
VAESKVKATVAKAGQAQPNGADSPGDSSPVGNRLGEMVEELLSFALHENLKPALERLGRDFEQQVAQAKTSALQESLEQIENHFNAFQARLEIRALDVVTQTEQTLEKKTAENIETVRQIIDVQQQEASQKFSDAIRIRLMQMVVAEEDRLRQETSDAVKAAVTGLQENLVVELARFTERVRARAEEMEETSLGRMQKLEMEVTERLKRFEEIGTRLTTQLETHADQVLEQSVVRLNQQMEDATTRVHQSFMRHIVTELSGKQSNFVEEAMKPLEAAAEQNLKRMRKELTRMVKEVGQRFVSGGDSEE